MKPGARSIRGAMGTYFWVSVVALVATAVWLASGGVEGAPVSQAILPADSGWAGATVGDGLHSVELEPGMSVGVSAGRWHVTLVPGPGGGEATLYTLETAGGESIDLTRAMPDAPTAPDDG